MKFIVTSAYYYINDGYIVPSFEVVGTKIQCRSFVRSFIDRANFVKDHYTDDQGNEITELILANGDEFTLSIQPFK